ncbi:MAG: ABC transporter ATP-binding protein [Burkholderiales bacterium]|nr:ABC transporter ATP-binding protein [Burkholderiales bacterium]
MSPVPTSPSAAAPLRGAVVRLDRLRKEFGGAVAVDDLSLEVGSGEFLTLLGPSGSGKSTTLLMIAGFVVPTRGEVYVGGNAITRKPPHERDIGIVFQNYALFPHLTVYDNVAFPLRMRKQPAARVAERVGWALDLIRLGGLGGRYPHQLSGGQQQRVALARALVFEPSLLLMDEPLGALDRRLRETMQGELKRLQRALGLTVICVTHDQEEALTLSDRIAIMNHGRIEHLGTPEDLYERPQTPFVAEFLGESNALAAKVLRDDGPRTIVRTTQGLEMSVRAGAAKSASEVRLAIRPERIDFLEPGESRDNVVDAVIDETVYLGDAVRYLLRTASGEGLTLKARCPAGGGPGIGDTVRVGWAADAVMVYANTHAFVSSSGLPPPAQPGEGRGGG